jgi:CheY-like chemotaxis protein
VQEPEAEPTTAEASTPAADSGSPASAPPPDLAELSHELGNRLASIIAFSHLIRTDPRLPDDLHEQAELLVEEAGRTRVLVARVLDAAAPSAGGPSPALAAPAAASTSARGSAPARILVVDDEPAIREFLARILRRIGHEPLLAADGAAALAFVRADPPPDAILCDHRTGAMSGAAFNDAVAKVAPELAHRFAFMTGDVTNPELRAVAAARGIPLLAKPFDIESVERTVAGILGS